MTKCSNDPRIPSNTLVIHCLSLSLAPREFPAHSQQKDACSGYLLTTWHNLGVHLSGTPPTCSLPSLCKYSISQLSEMFFLMLDCSSACLQILLPVSQQNHAMLSAIAQCCSEWSFLLQHIAHSITEEEGLREIFLNGQEGIAAPEGCSDLGTLPRQCTSCCAGLILHPQAVISCSLFCPVHLASFLTTLLLFK